MRDALVAAVAETGSAFPGGWRNFVLDLFDLCGSLRAGLLAQNKMDFAVAMVLAVRLGGSGFRPQSGFCGG